MHHRQNFSQLQSRDTREVDLTHTIAAALEYSGDVIHVIGMAEIA
jgi:hypothetical protein